MGKLKSMPFQGEMMCCVVCGGIDTSSPNYSKGWRCIEIDNSTRFYVCPNELPGAGSKPVNWSEAYMKIFIRIKEKNLLPKQVKSILIFREQDGKISKALLN